MTHTTPEAALLRQNMSARGRMLALAAMVGAYAGTAAWGAAGVDVQAAVLGLGVAVVTAWICRAPESWGLAGMVLPMGALQGMLLGLGLGMVLLAPVALSAAGDLPLIAVYTWLARWSLIGGALGGGWYVRETRRYGCQGYYRAATLLWSALLGLGGGSIVSIGLVRLTEFAFTAITPSLSISLLGLGGGAGVLVAVVIYAPRYLSLYPGFVHLVMARHAALEVTAELAAGDAEAGRRWVDTAFAELTPAVRLGIVGPRTLVGDPFLRILHADPRWGALLNGIR